MLKGWARVCFTICSVLAAGSLLAAEKGANELTLQTDRAIVFKDGYFLIIKRAVGIANEKGEVYTDDVPDSAVLGSFWAIPDEGKLINMHAGWRSTEETEDKELDCRDQLEILLANVGKQIKVETNDKTIYNGTILKVLADKTMQPIDPTFWDLRKSSINSAVLVRSLNSVEPSKTETLATFQGAHFVLRTEEGDVLLHVGNIRSLSIKEMATKINRTSKTTRKTKRLSFTVPTPGKKVSMSILYFRPGIRWIPTYRVTLAEKEGKKMANMALQAELLNEAEDLNNVPIDLVVGVPNFRFKDTISPMTLEATLRNTLVEAAPGLMGNNLSNGFNNASYSQRSSEFRHNAAQSHGVDEGTINLPNDLTATGSQDLFVYHLPKTTIGKGDRVAVSIFQSEAPYRDIYTWDVRVNRSDIETAPSAPGLKSPLSLAKNEVWHQIEVTNTSNVPWTTGAVLLMQGNQPLAQELLTYTSPKNVCRIPVTVAVELKGSFEEKEINRTLDSVRWLDHAYAKIEKQATVHLCNNKKDPVDVEITLRLGGRVTEASEKGDIELGAFRAEDWQNYNGSPAVNNSSTVTWKAKLASGEVIEPMVKYHFFSRH